jgi:hypothetical protein
MSTRVDNLTIAALCNGRILQLTEKYRLEPVRVKYRQCLHPSLILIVTTEVHPNDYNTPKFYGPRFITEKSTISTTP